MLWTITKRNRRLHPKGNFINNDDLTKKYMLRSVASRKGGCFFCYTRCRMRMHEGGWGEGGENMGYRIQTRENVLRMLIKAILH